MSNLSADDASGRRSGFVVYASAFGAGNLVLSGLGVVGNASVLVAIYKSPTLRLQVCTYLMGALAVADLFTCSMFSQFSIMVLIDYTYISNFECFLLLFPGLFAMNAQSFLIWMVGIDRTLLLLLPSMYTKWSRTVYVPCMVTPSVVYALVVVLIGYYSTNSDVVPVCVPPTAYRAAGQNAWVFSAVLISVFVVVTYVVAYCAAVNRGFGGRSQSDSESKRRLLGSLALVGAVYASSWMLTMLAVMAATKGPFDDFWQFHISLYVGYLADVNACCNPMVYAWRSEEWRRAILGTVWRVRRFSVPARTGYVLTGSRVVAYTPKHSVVPPSRQVGSVPPPPLMVSPEPPDAFDTVRCCSVGALPPFERTVEAVACFSESTQTSQLNQLPPPSPQSSSPSWQSLQSEEAFSAGAASILLQHITLQMDDDGETSANTTVLQ